MEPISGSIHSDTYRHLDDTGIYPDAPWSEPEGTGALRTHAADGMDTRGIASTLGLIGAFAGMAAATTAGGAIAGLCAGAAAVIAGVNALGEDHKQNGKPNPDAMKMDRPMDKK